MRSNKTVSIEYVLIDMKLKERVSVRTDVGFIVGWFPSSNGITSCILVGFEFSPINN